MNRPRTRALLAALIIVLGIPAGGVAFANWSASGSGTGTGATGTTAPLTLAPGTPSAGLYPGGQTAVLLTVANPNEGPIHVASLSLDTTQGTGGFAVDAGHAACSVAALSYATQSNGGAGWTIPAKVGGVHGTLPITLTNALTMSTSAANACQGATLTVYLAAG